MTRSLQSLLFNELLCVAVFCVFVTGFVTNVSAALPTAPRMLTQNPSFEQEGYGSLAGWTEHGSWGAGPTADVVLHNLSDTSPSRFDALVGSHQLRLRGQGGYGQVVELADDIERVLINGMAYALMTNGDPPNANRILPTLRVNFYDASWNEIDSREVQIAGADARQASRLNPYTLGLGVPTRARFALLVVFNFDQGVETLVDKLAMFDVTDRTSDGELRNVVFNSPAVETIGQDEDGSDYFLLGNEFWYSNVELADHPNGLTRWGSSEQSEWAWQPVDVFDDRLYQIAVNGELGGEVIPEVGLDFYGEQNGRVFLLQRRFFDVKNFSSFDPAVPFVAPAGTQFTTAHFLVPQLSGNASGDPNRQGAAAPEIVIFDIGSAPVSETETTTYYTGLGFYTPRFSTSPQNRGWGMRLWFRDEDGLDVDSVAVIEDRFGVVRQLRDIYFKSLSNPNLEYPALLASAARYSNQPLIIDQDEGREVGLSVLLVVDNIGDVGEMVIREGALLDNQGNPSPRIEYERFALPWEE